MNHNAEEKLKKVFNLTEKKMYQEALDIVDSVIAEEPEWFKPHHEKAKVYARQRMWEDAIDTVDEAIRLNPEEPMLYFSRARWLIQRHSFYEAVDDLDRLIELEEELGDTYYVESAFFFRALASSYIGNHASVLSDCEKVRDDYSIYILNKPHSKHDLVTLANVRLGN